MHKIVFSFDNTAVWVKNSGTITSSTIISMIHELSNLENLPQELAVFSDYRNCQIDNNSGIAGVESIVAAMINQFSNKVELLRWANLSVEPISAAGAMLIQNRLAAVPFIRYNIFSTEDAALTWLGVDKSIYPNSQNLSMQP